MKKWVIIGIVVVLIIIGIIFIKYIQQPKHIHDQSISGRFAKSQIWGGEILITGDVFISQDLLQTKRF